MGSELPWWPAGVLAGLLLAGGAVWVVVCTNCHWPWDPEVPLPLEANVRVEATPDAAIVATLLDPGRHRAYTDYALIVDGVACDPAALALRDDNGDGQWGVGETVSLAANCHGAPLASGQLHTVGVVLMGELVREEEIQL